MSDAFVVNRVAVLGAGVMGAQIAAHCVNAGMITRLFDLNVDAKTPNALVDKAIKNLTKQTPSPLAMPDWAERILARNYDEHLPELLECDLIIEAIAERLDWKEALYQRITPYLTPKTILVSNTSGLSVNALVSVLPEALRSQFCGVHFFNPPRYMHLAELIPTQHTSPVLLDNLETWLTRYLGKGVVRAKDTPNFIANRIGVFSLLATLHHAEKLSISFDEVDALTGTLLGRPKSATFRTMDVVGLDTLAHVVDTMKSALKEDPWHALFDLPSWMSEMISRGHLGQKSGFGVYRKAGKNIEVFDPRHGDYRTADGRVSDEVSNIFKQQDPIARMRALFASSDKQAMFLSRYFCDLFHYCAVHLVDIANHVRDVDNALAWGFGWKKGPFETWQASGVAFIKTVIEEAINHQTISSDVPLPSWLNHLDYFYDEEKRAFSPLTNTYMAASLLPVYTRQLHGQSKQDLVLFENDGVRSYVHNDVAIVSFKSKSNTINQVVLDGLQETLMLAESTCQGLVLYQNDASNFSSGANLKEILQLILENKFSSLHDMLASFQDVAMRLKYSALPVVAALRGRALGGGCELMMQCDAVVAAFESYPGLVEAGVGVIPAGGGCKEWAMRAGQSNQISEVLFDIRRYFEQTAMANVASSAPDALNRGFLRSSDTWVMHTGDALQAAIAKVMFMQASNYKAPAKTKFMVAGREGHALLQAGLINWLEGQFISSHDYCLANQLAFVLCGGDVNQGEYVDEAWLLRLEREAFMRLVATPLTQARIQYLLETGKPLRN